MRQLLYVYCLIFTISLSNTLFSQEWIKIYGDNISCYAYSVIETYDKGYIYGGKINDNSQTLPKFGWIFKTDINGEMLWDKKIGEIGDVTGVQDIAQTIDNGIILSGSTKKYDPWYDPFFLKLNTCGEKEWCKILHSNYDMDYGSKIIQLPNGNYIGLVAYTGDDPETRIWLVCTDESGGILWKKVYGIDDPYLNSEHGNDLMITPDSGILITGDAYYPDLPDTLVNKKRTYLIKTDFNGEKDWSLVWGKDEQCYGQSYSSAISRKKTIYSVGYHINTGQYPSLYKTSNEGEEITYYDIDSASTGAFSTISWFHDSTLAMGAGWIDANDNLFHPIIKFDTNGNFIKMRDLGDSIYRFQSSVVTFDNKLLITSAETWDGNFDIYAFKFNSELEYDSIYTQPFVYDSLCPYLIVSDTIPLDTLTVGMEDLKPEMPVKLTIKPSPSNNKIRVVLPEYISWQSKSAGFNVTTWNYNYKGDVPLEIYDIYGRRWYSEVIPASEKETEIDVSALPTGIYVVRVVIEGQGVSGKVVKE